MAHPQKIRQYIYNLKTKEAMKHKSINERASEYVHKLNETDDTQNVLEDMLIEHSKDMVMSFSDVQEKFVQRVIKTLDDMTDGRLGKEFLEQFKKRISCIEK